MKNIIILLIGVAIVASVLLSTYFITNNNDNNVVIGDLIISAEIAETSDEQRLGLSGRESLESDSGMLFVFKDEGDYGFWMKDMKIPLDIIWVDSERKIVHIERDVSPDTYPQVIKSPTPAQYVLEINAGLSDSNSLNIGDQAVFEF